MEQVDSSEKYAAFISHASEDRQAAEELAIALESRGLKCWIAYRDIALGSDYVSAISDGIRRSRCLVLLYSEAADRSKNVRAELEVAWRQDKPIYTVKLQDVPLSETISYYVQMTQWIDAWQGSLPAHIEELSREIMAPGQAGKPLRNLPKRSAFLRRARPLLLGLGGAVLGMVAIGYGVSHWLNGLQSRQVEQVTESLERVRPQIEDALARQREASSSRGGWMNCNRGFHGGIATCTLRRSGVPADSRLYLGASESRLDWVIDVDDPSQSRGVAYSSQGNRGNGPAYALPAKSGEIFGQLEVANGTRSETVRLGSPSSGEPEPLFEFTAESPEAPKLVGALMSTYRLYDSGGLWSLFPIVGEEVEAVTWTIHEGGANPAETYFGFFVIAQKPGTDLGATTALAGREAPALRVTYRYKEGRDATFSYRGDWATWINGAMRSSIRYEDLVTCQDSGSTYYGDPIIRAHCFLHSDEQASRVFKDIYWGTDPGDLQSLDKVDLEPVLERFRQVQRDYLAQQAQGPMAGNQAADTALSFENSLRRQVKPWRETRGSDMVLATVSQEDALYFKFVLLDGTESSVVRVALPARNR